MAAPALLGRIALGTLSSGFRGAAALASRVSTGIQGSARGFLAGAKSAGFQNAPGVAGAYARMSGLFARGGSGTSTGPSALERGMQQQVSQQVATNQQLNTLNNQTESLLNIQKDVLVQLSEHTKQAYLLSKKFESFAEEFSKVTDAMGLMPTGGAPPAGGAVEQAGGSGGAVKKVAVAGAAIVGAIVFRDEIKKGIEKLDNALRGRFTTGVKRRIGGPGTKNYTSGRRTLFDPQPPVSPGSEPPVPQPPVSPGSGSEVKVPLGPVIVRDPELAKLTRQQNEALKKITTATSGTYKITETNYKLEKQKETRPAKPTRAERILGQAQADFLKGFEDTTTRIFREGLEKLLPTPGVSAADAAGEMYRGQQLRKMAGLDKAANKIFGKDYGPLFAELGTAYLEVGASALAENLFASTFGTDEKGALKSRTVGGQVLGNLASGKKTRAAESLVYGLTGIPTGVESLANYMGFSSAKEGVGFVADVLGAATTEFLRPSSFKGPKATYTDPRTGETYSYGGGFMDILTGQGQGVLSPQSADIKAQKARQAALRGRTVTSEQGGGIGNVPALMTDGIATMPVTIVGDETKAAGIKGPSSTGSIFDAWENVDTSTPMFAGSISQDDVAESTVDTSKTIHQLYENTDEWGSRNEELTIDTSRADIQTQQQVGTGIMGTFQQVGTFLMAGLDKLGQIFMSRPAGGGTSVNIGGFGGSGDFMSMIGNVVGSTAIAYGVNKLTSKIKDPNLRMIANVAGNFAGQKFLMGNLGGIGGTGASIFSQGQALASVGDFFTQNFPSMKDFLPGGGIGGGIPGNLPGGTSGPQVPGGFGNFTGGFDLMSPSTWSMSGFSNYLSSGWTNLMSGNVAGPMTAFQNASTLGKIGQGIGYTYALYQLSQGNVAGAATSAFSTYAFASGNPYLMAGAVILNFLGIGKKKPKVPVVERAIAIRGNNDPTQIRTIQERHADMSGMFPGLDAMLTVAFNTLKMIERDTNGKTPFTHASIFIRSGEATVISLYRESEFAVLISDRGDKWGEIKHHKNFGNPSDVFKNPGTLSSNIVKFIKESAIAELGQSEEAAIAKAATRISSKTMAELSSGELRELGLNPELSSFYGVAPTIQAELDKLMEKQKLGSEMGLTKEGTFLSTKTEQYQYYETVSGGDSSDYQELRTGTRSVGLVDAGTGEIVPWGTEIKYTDANGVDKTIKLDYDANNIAAIVNGIPIFGKFRNTDINLISDPVKVEDYNFAEYANRIGLVSNDATFIEVDTSSLDPVTTETAVGVKSRIGSSVQVQEESDTVTNITPQIEETLMANGYVRDPNTGQLVPPGYLNGGNQQTLNVGASDNSSTNITYNGTSNYGPDPLASTGAYAQGG